MGEFTDWGGMGLDGSGGGQLPDADVDTAGAGGDPFGGGDFGGVDPGGDFAESASQGALPGGADGQYSPFSPNGGVDVTDLWGTSQASMLAKSFSLGPGGNIMKYDDGGSSGGAVVGGARASTAAIVRYVKQTTGLRVTARSIVGLIVRYGFPAAAALTKLQLPQLLALFMQQKGVRHHRRGPGLYTIGRKLRAADRLRQHVARVLGRGGGHRRRRARGGFHTMRRRRRR